jgi:hypothetical protein
VISQRFGRLQTERRDLFKPLFAFLRHSKRSFGQVKSIDSKKDNGMKKNWGASKIGLKIGLKIEFSDVF